MKRKIEFLDILLRGTEPSPTLLGAFALGLLVTDMMANLLYDLLTALPERPATVLRPAVMILCLIGLAYLLYVYDRRQRSMIIKVDESRLAPPHAGLIWLLGPGSFDHLLFALEHHYRKGGGSHCWLVMQDIEAVRQVHNQLSQKLSDKGLKTRLHPVYIKNLDVQAAYQAVRKVFEHEAAEEGLTREEIIADITGGTKPLTAGMVLAAITIGGKLEYVESERNPEGDPVPNTLRVVLVDTAFYVSEKLGANATAVG